ncbi:hypothetical protein [Microbacterium sp. cf332]|uniref:hypothetical protein n=1 Tax=Microbacterium sp. cf332 TaxID=1761804 RepID=UPI00088AC040|nr:hypothetical protein [Microbacterium sp. cf332]SDQ12870.1 hypothetical protein SAMN04487847_0499 [Microbacterium sp. cf332]
MTSRDDDALSWAGDDDPTLVSAPTRDSGLASRPSDAAAPPTHPSEPAPAQDLESAGDPGTADAGRPAMSSAALVSFGVLGGIYLLYTVGWIVGGLRLNDIAGFIVAPTASVPAIIVAILAPAVWFGVTFLLTRGRATWLRFVWLVAGAVLLVPWPFAMLGTGL